MVYERRGHFDGLGFDGLGFDGLGFDGLESDGFDEWQSMIKLYVFQLFINGCKLMIRLQFDNLFDNKPDSPVTYPGATGFSKPVSISIRQGFP